MIATKTENYWIVTLEKPIINYIHDTDLPEANYIKWFKIILGKGVSSECESHHLRTSPLPTRVIIRKYANKIGTNYYTYEGNEVVNFKYFDIRGTFNHNGDILLNMTTNYTTFKELIECIAEIAVHCRFDMRNTESSNYMQMKQDTRDKEPRCTSGEGRSS